MNWKIISGLVLMFLLVGTASATTYTHTIDGKQTDEHNPPKISVVVGEDFVNIRITSDQSDAICTRTTENDAYSAWGYVA